MKETKHTKGKWITQGADGYGNLWLGNHEGTTIGSVYIPIHDNLDMTKATAEANARLIVAAPELFEALQVCFASLQTYGSHPIIEKQVKNAIAKAIEQHQNHQT